MKEEAIRVSMFKRDDKALKSSVIRGNLYRRKFTVFGKMSATEGKRLKFIY